MVVAPTSDADAPPTEAPGEPAPDGHVRVGRLLKLEDEFSARERDLGRRERHLEQEQAVVDAAHAAVENDRRAVEQQAMALWEARARLESERKLLRQRHRLAFAETGSPQPPAGAASEILDAPKRPPSPQELEKLIGGRYSHREWS